MAASEGNEKGGRLDIAFLRKEEYDFLISRIRKHFGRSEKIAWLDGAQDRFRDTVILFDGEMQRALEFGGGVRSLANEGAITKCVMAMTTLIWYICREGKHRIFPRKQGVEIAAEFLGGFLRLRFNVEADEEQVEELVERASKSAEYPSDLAGLIDRHVRKSQLGMMSRLLNALQVQS